jgi:glyoxylase-like metal-dependent hydrolase (beta-lactamase superfamily II)
VSGHPPAEVSPGVWLIPLPLPFPIAVLNVYLIRGREGYVLMDCGLKTQACREALEASFAALGVRWPEIRTLVLTHIHPDHFGLAAEIRRRSGAKVLMHRAEADCMPRWRDEGYLAQHAAWLAEHGVPAGEAEEIGQAAVGVAEFVEVAEPDRLIEDGERIPVAGGELETVFVPGHAAGLLTFFWRERRLLFSSDHILEKVTPNIGLHALSSENPLGDYLESLERVRGLDIDLMLPSHGRPFRGHREWIAATEQHHRERCGRMLAAVDGVARTAHEVVGIEWGPHLSPLAMRFAVAEVLAHLEYLRRQGKVECRREGGVVRWRKT